MAPGKKPALSNRVSMKNWNPSVHFEAGTHSNNPSNTRTPHSSAKFLTKPWQVITMPQAVMIAPMNMDGRSNRLRIALLGTSASCVSFEIPGPVRFMVQLTSQGVRDEEDRQSNVVLGTSHVQVRQKALDFGIACREDQSAGCRAAE